MSDFVWSVPSGDGSLSTGTSSAPLAKIDHVAAGLNRLPQQWRTSPNMIALLSVFLARYNDLEQAYQDLLLLRNIDTANADDPNGTVGAALDRLGRIAGQLRNGLTNTVYRRYIKARIKTNNSNGRFEDLITIAFLIVNDPAAIIRVTNTTNTTVIVEVTGAAVDNATADVAIGFLKVAVDGGVRLLLETHPVEPATFRFGVGAGFGTSGDAGQPTLTAYGTTGVTGGRMADIRE